MLAAPAVVVCPVGAPLIVAPAANMEAIRPPTSPASVEVTAAAAEKPIELTQRTSKVFQWDIVWSVSGEMRYLVVETETKTCVKLFELL